MRKHLFLISILSTLITILVVAFCVFSINSTLNDGLTSADYSLFSQVNYNFFNERSFQTSFYVGESSYYINPFEYASVLIYHGYFLSFLPATSYLFSDWVGNTYLFFVFFNLLGITFFSYKIFRFSDPAQWKEKFLLAFYFILAGGILHHCFSRGIPIQLAMPFFLGAYYFFISKRIILFNVFVVLICLLQEDLSTVVLTTSVYVFIFEKQHRKYTYFPLLFSVGYLFLWVLVLQKIIRTDLITLVSNNMWEYRFWTALEQLKNIFTGNSQYGIYMFVKTLVSDASNLLVFFYGAVGIKLFFEPTKTTSYPKLVLFIILAPCAYWAYCFVGGGFVARFSIPIVCITFIAFIRLLKNNQIPANFSKIALIWLYFPLLTILPLNFLITEAIAHPIDSIGKENLNRDFMLDQSQEFFGLQIINIDDKYKKVMKSNKSVIAVTDSLPKNKSLCYWINYSYESFLMNRSDIWCFPKNYDKTDFIIIQKDAEETNFHAENLSQINYQVDSVANNYYAQSAIPNGYTHNIITPIKHLLVDSLQTHKIAHETEYLLLLERKEHHIFPMPVSTMGFGWLLKNNSTIKNK